VTDPEIEHIGRFEWERIVRRCVIPRDTKLVAFLLAQYASPNGSNVRPGNGAIADVCGMSERTAVRHLKALRDLYLITKTANGGGPKKRAANYRLTIPVDLLERVKMLEMDDRTHATMNGASSDETHATLDGVSSPTVTVELTPKQGPEWREIGRTHAIDPPLTSNVRHHHPLTNHDHPIRDFGGDVTSPRRLNEDRLIQLPPGIDLRAALKSRRESA